MAIWNKDDQSFNSNNTTQFEAVVIADKDGNLQNSTGAASNIPIAAGDVSGYSHINKFGYSDNIQTSSTIWDGQNIYTYSASAGPVTVESNAGANGDDGAIIEVQGLDSSYNLVTQDIAISGATGTGTTDLIRVFRARVKDAADGEATNVGEIDIDIDGALRARILEGKGQTLMAVYTVPAGKTAYLLNLTMSVDKNVDAIFQLMVQTFENRAINIKGQFGTFGTPFDHNYPIPLRFTEKTDIEVRADAGSTCGGGATFDLILVDNPS